MKLNKTLTLKILAAASVLALTQTVFAQAASSATPVAPTATKTALINKMILLQQPGVENIARMLIQQPLGNMMQGVGSALQQMPTDKRDATAKLIEVDVRKFADEMVALLRDRGVKTASATWTPILDERFSEDELKQVIAWLESPASKKYQQAGSDMQNALGQKMVADSRNTVEARLKTLEQTVTKTMGLSPKPATPAAPAASGAKK